MEHKLWDAVSKLPQTSLQFDQIQSTQEPKKTYRMHRSWLRIAAVAACLALLASIGFGTYAYAAEVKEYNDAVRFFQDYGLSTDGLTRGEIKAVYRDITTRSFIYSKTAEVIQDSLTSEHVGGFEILQENPTPEDVENLWNYKNFNGRYWVANQDHSKGVRYSYGFEYKMDSLLGFEVLNYCHFEKYEGDALIWSVSLPEFSICGYRVVSDGVIVYGETDTWTSEQTSYALLAKIDANGSLLWKQKLDNGFQSEYIGAVVENADGSYAVFSGGDSRYFCLSQYTADGTLIHFQKTDIGSRGIWNAARFGDGYIVQLGSYIANAQIVMVDHEGNITGSFSYCSGDVRFSITDMIEFDGNIYLSTYAFPNPGDENRWGSRYEIASVVRFLRDNISSEELTRLVRENYTAVLLVCDPKAGTPREFYSVRGSLGGRLSVSDAGTLLWDVESITANFYSLAASSFTIGGTSYVYRYTFDQSGMLISQEKTGEVVNFRR